MVKVIDAGEEATRVIAARERKPGAVEVVAELVQQRVQQRLRARDVARMAVRIQTRMRWVDGV